MADNPYAKYGGVIEEATANPYAKYGGVVESPGGGVLTPPGDTFGAPNPHTGEAPPTFKQMVHAGIDYLPMLGGAAGGAIGGAVGTPLPVAGNLVGGVAGASLGGGAGEFTKQMIQKALFPDEAPKSFGEGAKNVGMASAEQGLSELVPRAVFAGAGKLIGSPRAIVERTIKPTKALQEKVPGAMQSILDEGVHTSDAARGVINDLNNEVGRQINASAVNGATVKLQPLWDSLDALRAKALKNMDAKGVKEVDDYIEGLHANPHLIDLPGYKHPITGQMTPPLMRDEIPVDLAHQMKVESGKGLPWGERGSYRDEAGKTGVNVLREGVSKSVPEVAETNGRIHNLLGAEDALGRMEGNEARKNGFFNIPTMVGAMTGGGGPAMMHNPIAAGGGALAGAVAAKLATNPRVNLTAAQLAEYVRLHPAAQNTLNAVTPDILRYVMGTGTSKKP